MNTLARAMLIASLLASSSPLLADEKSDFALLHALSSIQANRIVGVWEAQVDVGACAGGPRRQFRGLNAFHLGGTLSDTNFAPPTTRGPGMGTWVYDRSTRVYQVRMSFYRYLPDGTFDGLQDVHREITLGEDFNTSSEEIYARALNPDGTLRMEQCGSATATRIAIED